MKAARQVQTKYEGCTTWWTNDQSLSDTVLSSPLTMVLSLRCFFVMRSYLDTVYSNLFLFQVMMKGLHLVVFSIAIYVVDVLQTFIPLPFKWLSFSLEPYAYTIPLIYHEQILQFCHWHNQFNYRSFQLKSSSQLYICLRFPHIYTSAHLILVT